MHRLCGRALAHARLTPSAVKSEVELTTLPRQMLGYTFEIRDMGYTVGNETWTDHLIRVAREADLTGCWWVHSEAHVGNPRHPSLRCYPRSRAS